MTTQLMDRGVDSGTEPPSGASMVLQRYWDEAQRLVDAARRGPDSAGPVTTTREGGGRQVRFAHD